MNECFDVFAFDRAQVFVANVPGLLQQSLNIAPVAIERTQAAGVGLQEAARHVEVFTLRRCQVRRCHDGIDLFDRIEQRRRCTAHTGQLGWFCHGFG